MIANHTARNFPLALIVTILCLLAVVTAGAQAAAPPIKEIETSHFGWEVNQTTKGEICTIASGDVCQPGVSNSAPGAFTYPESIAGAPGGNVYVIDRGNHRVQEFEHDGKFVLMFGKGVNKKGTAVCTAAEAGECQAGVESSAPGAFGAVPQSIAVDPVSGDVYVAETLTIESGESKRVQEFTASGVFVLELGREVNETKDQTPGATPVEKNLCTGEEVESSGVKCEAPTVGGSSEPGEFHFEEERGNMLAVGGPEDLLYVGDEHRVQEFDAKTGAGNGRYRDEISLTGISSAPREQVLNLAVDAAGKTFLVYASPQDPTATREVIREFDPSGKEAKDFPVGLVQALAVDPSGRLAVSETVKQGLFPVARGSLYEVAGQGLHLISQFPGRGSFDLTFNGQDELFEPFGSVTQFDQADQEVIAYRPVPVGELVVHEPACSPGSEHETDATLNCALRGEVNPFGVVGTEVWFRWGRTPSLDEETAKQPVVTGSAPVGVSAPIAGLVPNETLYDQLAGEDENVRAPEVLTSTTEVLTTPMVAPRIVGAPEAAFFSPTSAVLFGALNPENAPTRYWFQYAQENSCNREALQAGQNLTEACPTVLATSSFESSEYGRISAAFQASGLQPSTLYRYRLYAENSKAEGAIGETGGMELPEGAFETARAAAVAAQTGDASQITTTSAIVSGTVNADGQQSAYTFELGVYEGAATHYGVVLSAAAGNDTVPVGEELALTGLQPATTYAYRIAVHFGDGRTAGSSATGETRTFTTPGLPSVLASPEALSLLAVPAIAFPRNASVTATKTSTRAQKPANALKGCKKKSRRQRAACEHRAQRQHGKSAQARNREKGKH